MLADKSFSDVDLWRKGAISIRNKFGIYRSLVRKMQSASDRPDNGLKDESLQLADFIVYEAHTNPNPQPHDSSFFQKITFKNHFVMTDKMIILLSQIPFFPPNGGEKRKNASIPY